MRRGWPFCFVLCMLPSVLSTSAGGQHAPHSVPSVPQELLERRVSLRSGIGAAHDDAGTKSKDAQAFYDQGLAYLHSYVWIEAARSFNEALRRDATLAHAHVGLMWEGQDYGKHNLNQLDIKLAKRFTIDRVRLRVDFDLYNVFNSSWPYTVQTAYANTATSNWQRPTNVLQHRFFKFGGQFSF